MNMVSFMHDACKMKAMVGITVSSYIRIYDHILKRIGDIGLINNNKWNSLRYSSDNSF